MSANNTFNESPKTNQTVKIPFADLYPIIYEQLNNHRDVVIPVTGWSMQPTMYHLESDVTFTLPNLPLKENDIALFRMNNGKFIMHRVVKIYTDGSYKFQGDNNWTCEDHIQPNQIIATVKSFTRKGKTIDVNKSIPYKIYSRLWKYLRWLKIFVKKF